MSIVTLCNDPVGIHGSTQDESHEIIGEHARISEVSILFLVIQVSLSLS